MVKKITFTFISLAVLSVVLTGFFAVAVFDLAPSPAYAKENTYNNPISVYELQNRIREKTEVELGEREVDLSAELLLSSQQAAPQNPRAKQSIQNYYYSQTKTTNPLAVYSFADKVAGFTANESELLKILQLQAEEIDQEAQDAKLIIENEIATRFQPHKVGKKLDLTASAKSLKASLLSASPQKTNLVIHETPPAVTLSQTNDLGIKELIGRGVSDFSGSSRARVHNIAVGAKRYDGLIIQPGEQFSFNEYLGPVTAAAGFLPELVIKAEGTVPEFGGGLCQVSSTAFRAAFFTGTRIDERKNHSYAVKYYRWINEETPAAEGMDATIYPGVVDMKFTNDTPGSILISTYLDGNRLYFDFYGTPDDRKVIFSGPETYDRRQSGALKAKVTRQVIRAGEVSEDVFYSNYVSPDLYPRTYEFAEGEEPKEKETQPLDEQTTTIN